MHCSWGGPANNTCPRRLQQDADTKQRPCQQVLQRPDRAACCLAVAGPVAPAADKEAAAAEGLVPPRQEWVVSNARTWQKGSLEARLCCRRSESGWPCSRCCDPSSPLEVVSAADSSLTKLWDL